MSSKRELAVAKLLQRDAASAARHVDLCLEIWLDGEDEPLLVVGGRWDRVTNSYDGEAESAVVIRLHRGQADAARWFAQWLKQHLALRTLRAEGTPAEAAVDEIYGDHLPQVSALLYGGRRGGKSYVACVFAALMALAVPGARVVCVSPLLSHTEELRQVIEHDLLAREWRLWKEADQRFELANGSQIEFLTARKSNLKIGRIDLALLNEAQEQAEIARQDLAGCLVDSVGLLLATANPPRSRVGAWVRQWHEQVAINNRPSSTQFFLNPARNPHVPRSVLESLRDSLGELQYRREVLGDMTAPMVDVVFPYYSDHNNLLTFIPTGWRDITAQVAGRWYDREAGWIIGADFDKRAGCTWIGARFYQCDPDDDLDQAVMVIEFCETNLLDEQALAKRLYDVTDEHSYRLFYPNDTVIVGDASGGWQDTKRDPDRPDRSFRVLEDADWTVIRPDPNLKGNPRRHDRFALANYLLRQSSERAPMVYVLATAEAVIDSLREFPMRGENPDRYHRHAHPADGWTYVAWRRWGRDPDANPQRVLDGYQGVPRKPRSEVFGR